MLVVFPERFGNDGSTHGDRRQNQRRRMPKMLLTIPTFILSRVGNSTYLDRSQVSVLSISEESSKSLKSIISSELVMNN